MVELTCWYWRYRCLRWLSCGRTSPFARSWTIPRLRRSSPVFIHSVGLQDRAVMQAWSRTTFPSLLDFRFNSGRLIALKPVWEYMISLGSYQPAWAAKLAFKLFIVQCESSEICSLVSSSLPVSDDALDRLMGAMMPVIMLVNVMTVQRYMQVTTMVRAFRGPGHPIYSYCTPPWHCVITQNPVSDSSDLRPRLFTRRQTRGGGVGRTLFKRRNRLRIQRHGIKPGDCGMQIHRLPEILERQGPAGKAPGAAKMGNYRVHRTSEILLF